ncbi:phosphatidylinositol 3,4,5-trisphosphate 3-phosphatase [Gossypium australe]|uniref:Phosphatidylinositol 3,4,5-trisphosphate 3-phosphatase n=1 Tax=Gossypium australe TaxID=47621 RepID=A0A5B6VG02_9ROSI|nr:phosphatidylinositol 3,4,5-trisphosphate 3-phosphatase [Gossypium australe]
MDNGPADSSSSPAAEASDVQLPAATDLGQQNLTHDSPSKLSSWAKNLKIPQPFAASQEDSQTETAGKSPLARFTSGIGLRSSPTSPPANDSNEGNSPTAQPGFFGTITNGIVNTSKNAVKAVQVKARHVVSQNKRRFQEGGFDLDMTYITENIIAMGFPAGDMSSGFFGYVEGFYRNHMEEVIRFFETHHKDKYKVYNLCSERLYDASLFEGKVASFPFDDHNCPPIQLIISFCQSAYSWLKEDIENVVVVHCKAGMARTGLMISSLLLYLKFFPTAEESIDYYNQKRCVDGKGLVLPSQIRYVKYFERTLIYFNGENQPGRRCMLRGFRLHHCPYWIRPSITVSDHNGVLFSTKKHPRTKDLSPEDFWFSAPKKGVMVFALPGESGLTELAGDFKVHFNDRQGDFYCWLNTTMIENRKLLSTGDLDGFDKRKLPSPGFQVEIVLVDYNGTAPTKSQTETPTNKQDESSGTSESAEGATSKSKTTNSDQVASLVKSTEKVSLGSTDTQHTHAINEPRKDTVQQAADAADARVSISSSESQFKAMAADASVFSFGDEEDFDSE